MSDIFKLSLQNVITIKEFQGQLHNARSCPILFFGKAIEPSWYSEMHQKNTKVFITHFLLSPPPEMFVFDYIKSFKAKCTTHYDLHPTTWVLQGKGLQMGISEKKMCQRWTCTCGKDPPELPLTTQGKMISSLSLKSLVSRSRRSTATYIRHANSYFPLNPGFRGHLVAS